MLNSRILSLLVRFEKYILRLNYDLCFYLANLRLCLIPTAFRMHGSPMSQASHEPLDQCHVNVMSIPRQCQSV
jgi:hypothetical protein